MTFEENLSALADITKKLEEGALTLEESVELYHKGMSLSAECSKQLKKAKLQIIPHTEEGDNE